MLVVPHAPWGTTLPKHAHEKSGAVDMCGMCVVWMCVAAPSLASSSSAAAAEAVGRRSACTWCPSTPPSMTRVVPRPTAAGDGRAPPASGRRRRRACSRRAQRALLQQLLAGARKSHKNVTVPHDLLAAVGEMARRSEHGRRVGVYVLRSRLVDADPRRSAAPARIAREPVRREEKARRALEKGAPRDSFCRPPLGPKTLVERLSVTILALLPDPERTPHARRRTLPQ